MDPVTGAVVIVGLNTVGRPSAKIVADFLNRILAPVGDATGAILADPIQRWHQQRVERAQRIVETAAQRIAATGRETHPVPGRVLMPILEHGSIEEEPELCERWITLLESAALDPDAIPASYSYVLMQLSPVDVKILDWLYDKGLPNIPARQAVEALGAAAFLPDYSTNTFVQVFANLERLGLIDAYTNRELEDSPYDPFDYCSITNFAVGFIEACRRRRP